VGGVMSDLRREESLDFLAKGLVAADRLNPRTKVAWQHELRAEIERRNGVP
jgi:hypothetical protein